MHIKSPLVSIVVPAYNVEEYLGRCLASVASQVENNIEIVVVDDGSTDDTLLVAKDFASKDNRFVLVTQENRGLGGARNRGIVEAKGDFVLFVDSDDYIESSMVRDLLAEAKKTGSDIVRSYYIREEEDGTVFFKQRFNPIKTGPREEFRILLDATATNIACCRLYKRELLINHDIFFPEKIYHEDLWFTYKAYWHARQCSTVDAHHYHWVIRDDSISRSCKKKHIDDIYKGLDDVRNFLKEKNILGCYYEEYCQRVYHFTCRRVFSFTYNFLAKSLGCRGGRSHTNPLLFLYAILLYFSWFIKELFTGGNAKILCSFNLSRVGEILMSFVKKCVLKIVDIILPKDTARREFIKRCVYGRPEYADNTGQGGGKGGVAKHVVEKWLPVREGITDVEKKRIHSLKGRFEGQRCFIVGNGPSLNKCDLTKLKNEYTFGVNGIFYKTEEMGFKPTFYVVEDKHVIDDNLEKINAFDCEYKFFPSLYKEKIIPADNTYFYCADLGFYRGNKPEFSYDASDCVYAGQSVTYMNMQLAHYLGFYEVYLIGVDFSYSVPKSTEIRGKTYVSNEDDPNHFHPDYFGKGKKWHDPQLDRVALNYQKAHDSFTATGRSIKNATAGGNLEIFPRVDYDSLF